MPTIIKTFIPITDFVDTASVEHIRTYDGEDEEIALIPITVFEDDFDDNSLDPTKWNEADTGGNINEVNQRIEGKGNDSWNANGLVSDSGYVVLNGFELTFSVTLHVSSINVLLAGIADSTTLDNAATTGAIIYFYNGDIYVSLNGVAYLTTYDYQPGKTYNIRITYMSPQWYIYVQSDDDTADFSDGIERPVYVLDSVVSGTVYSHINFYDSAGFTYIDNWKVYNGYPSSSPSPDEVWNSFPIGSIIDMSTIHIPELLNDGSGSIKYKYASNGGSLNSTWLTQAQLRLESNIVVSNSTNSFKIVPQLISDGTQYASLETNARIDVTYPTDGIVTNKLNTFSPYGHRRIF